MSGLPYTYPHWLYDFGMYQIYKLGGWDAIYASTCIFASILGVCIYLVNSRLNKSKLISFLVTIAVMYFIRSYIAARAQLVTFILFILFVYNIEKFIQSKKIKNAITIILIHLLIANLHVAVWPFTFVLYLPYVAEYIIAVLIEVVLYKKLEIFILKQRIKITEKNLKVSKSQGDIEKYTKKLEKLNYKLNFKEQKALKIKNKREEDRDKEYKITIKKNNNVKWLFLIMIIGALAGLLTPLGKVPFTYNYLTMIGNTMHNINEHLPLTLINNTPMLCTLIVIIAIVAFTRVKIRLSDLFMLGGLIYLMFSSRRQQSMLLLIGSIMFGRLLVNLVKVSFGYDAQTVDKKFINKYIVTVICLLVLIWSTNLYKQVYKDEYVSKSSYPVEASEWILNNLDIKNIKLFNEYNYGSYLLYKGIPVFIDSRADLYAPEYNSPTRNVWDGNDIFIDFINSSGIATYYGDIFEKYEITHVILYKSSKINMLITKTDTEKYKELYSDDNFVIYEVLKY